MYAEGNPKSGAELKRWLAAGKKIRAFSPGPFGGTENGFDVIEMPHYPQPHRYYCKVEIRDGIIVRACK